MCIYIIVQYDNEAINHTHKSLPKSFGILASSQALTHGRDTCSNIGLEGC